MITIFNGRQRQLGQKTETTIYVQVSVALRNYLHLFRGAPLGVFMAIALHANEEGWAWPSRKTLARETGYNVQTVSDALTYLDELTIEGNGVLLIVQPRNAGKYEGNRYLLFPTADDIELWVATGLTRKTPSVQNIHTEDPEPYVCFPSTAEPATDTPSTEDMIGRNSIEKEIQNQQPSSSSDDDDEDDPLREIDGLTRAEALLIDYGTSTKVAKEFRAVNADAIAHFIEKRLKGHPRDEWAKHLGSAIVAMRKLGKLRIEETYELDKNPWRKYRR